MYVDDSIWNAILGTFIFASLLVFVGTTAIHAYRKVRGLIRKLDGEHAKPSTVEMTLNQMYGDVNVKPDANYANAKNYRQHWRRGG